MKCARIASISALILFSFLKPWNAFAQNAEDSLVFNPLRKDKVVIPFELINNLAIIEARINDSPPLKFIVDSGVSRTIISELPLEGKISLNRVDKVALRGLGGEQLIYGFRSPENVLRIGNAVGHGAEVIILEQDLLQLSKLMGTYVHGIIGYDIFKSFIVEFDFYRNTIVLYEKSDRKKINRLKRSRRWQNVPLEVEDKKAFVEMNVFHDKKAEAKRLRLLLDTGNSGALTLLTNEELDIKIPKSRQSGLLGIGLGGEIYGNLGRVHKTTMGKFTFREPIVAYPDSSFAQALHNAKNRNGSIGSDILRRFKVVYDYKGGNLLLRKNEFYRDEFTYNRSGIDISTPIPNVPVYKISQIRDGSEAQKSGLMIGDQVTQVHGKPTLKMSFSQVLKYFRKGKDERIELEVKRDSVTLSIQYNLDEILKVDS